MKLETEHVFMCPLCEELNDMELRESQTRDLQDHTEFWSVWEKWPTSWSHPKDCQEFMMCFTFSQLKKYHAEMANIPV